MSCFFSVIIPVYNTEKYLNQCVTSILTQTFEDLQVILVDDGSTDNSPKICDELAAKDPRVSVVHKQNGGLSSARNAGIRASKGEYVMFLDSDDYFTSNACALKLYTELKNDPCDVLLFKSLKYYEEKDSYVDYYGDYDLKYFQKRDPNEVFYYMVKEHKQFACACNRAIKRDIFSNGDLFFEEGVTAEDIEWSVKLFKKIKSANAVNENVHVYRQGVSTSITASLSPKKFESLSGIVTRLIEEYEDKNDAFSLNVKRFMAFEYAILLLNTSCLDNYAEYKHLTKYDHIFKYSTDKKTKITKLIYKVFGFNGLMRIFRIKRRIK